MSHSLTHFDAQGQAHMVDVSGKNETHRRAIAGGRITMSNTAFMLVEQGDNKKGDVLAVARIAAIQAAKQTAHLIPLCHPLPLTHISVEFTKESADCSVSIQVIAETVGKTGVEMEALTAASVGLLTIYDMLKAVDKGMQLEQIALLQKEGGKSGHWQRDAC